MPRLINNEQLEVITYSGKDPLQVIAGPGSGKTTTILNRLFHLLKSNLITEQTSAVITFTKAAASELQNRFYSLCNEQSLSYQVFFGTFHSFFYQILLHSGCIKPNCFLTLKQKTDMLQEAIQFVNTVKLSENDRIEIAKQECRAALEAFSLYKNTLDLDKIYCIKSFPEPYEIFLRYESIRKSKGGYDYDDLQWDCYQLFQANHLLLKSWKEYFSGMFLDEFQDINRIQYELIKLLYRPGLSLTVVGDDDQSIYGFRGSNPYWMKHFKTDFSAHQSFLKQNYRCSQEIVELSGKLIGNNCDRIAKEFFCKAPQNQGKTVIKGYSSAKEQFEKIGQQIKILGGSNAVLFRTNSGLQKAAFILKRKGFSVHSNELKEDDSFVESDLMNYLRYIYTDDRTALYAILNKPYRGITKEKLLQVKGLSLEEIIAFYRKPDPCSVTADQLCKFQQQCICAKKLAIGPCLFYISKIMGYENYLVQKAGSHMELKEVYLENLDYVKKQLLECKTYEDVLLRYSLMEQVKRKATIDSGRNGIELLTLHSSKGLEFDHVWIPDCNEGILPYGTILNPAITLQTIEEERRLLYVGMTRAKTYLELSYIIPSKDSTRKISRFIEELK